MKKIVVTGATSMIGTALIEVAVREKTEVYAIIRPKTNRIDRLISSPLVHIVYGELDELMQIKDIPSDCDVFYHFAWAGTSKQTRDDPDIQEQNIRYTLDAVELARKTGCRRFVGAGSQAEYGPVYEIIDENTKFAPITSYGISKYAANILSRKSCEKLGLEHVWGRIFSVYGPHDNEGTMIKYAIDCWEKGEVARFSAGTQYWNYLYESDAGEMFFRMGQKDVKADTYFVANYKSIQLKEYLRVLMTTYGNTAKADIAKDNKVPIYGLNVDMTKTISAIGIIHQLSFKNGIIKILEERKK